MPPIVKTGFVDPAVAKSPLEPTKPKPATPTLNLGPSAPHFDDDPSLDRFAVGQIDSGDAFPVDAEGFGDLSRKKGDVAVDRALGQGA